MSNYREELVKETCSLVWKVTQGDGTDLLPKFFEAHLREGYELYICEQNEVKNVKIIANVNDYADVVKLVADLNYSSVYSFEVCGLTRSYKINMQFVTRKIELDSIYIYRDDELVKCGSLTVK